MRPLQPIVRQLTTPTSSPTRRPRRRSVRRLALFGALIGATGLAACGGGDDATPAPASAATATPPPASAPAKSSAPGTEAKIADFAFSPANIEVEAGDEITWTNDDTTAHTVTATSGAAFDSGTLAQGAEFTFEARKAGTIAYFCAIHPSMKGTITVR
ncbi:MAG TPA: cupredoxin family copper-binding protein [Solirubrobacteraceae bacterium]|nr:cupredoxin family copper-binding protein [Solirubrobacteraceae bacterium]